VHTTEGGDGTGGLNSRAGHCLQQQSGAGGKATEKGAIGWQLTDGMERAIARPSQQPRPRLQSAQHTAHNPTNNQTDKRTANCTQTVSFALHSAPHSALQFPRLTGKTAIMHTVRCARPCAIVQYVQRARICDGHNRAIDQRLHDPTRVLSSGESASRRVWRVDRHRIDRHKQRGRRLSRRLTHATAPIARQIRKCALHSDQSHRIASHRIGRVSSVLCGEEGSDSGRTYH
jgi:hypothetical protein